MDRIRNETDICNWYDCKEHVWAWMELGIGIRLKKKKIDTKALFENGLTKWFSEKLFWNKFSL